MKPDIAAAPTATLETVAQQFEHWRATRVKKGKIPDALWELVTPLLNQYNLNEITTALKLNYTQLKERISLLAPQQQKPAMFVEYSLPMVPASTGNGILEFSCKNGTTVKMSGLASEQIQSLISLIIGT